MNCESEEFLMVKEKLKKVAVLGAMCMLFSTTAYAANKDVDFDYIAKGEDGYTANNAKDDNEEYAYVTVTSENLISGDKVKYVVSNSEKTKEVSAAVICYGTQKPYKQTLKYKSGYAQKGKKYRLKIHTYNYSLMIHGRWNS